MKCINCGSNDTRVLDTRMTDDDTQIRRRRECNICKYRFTTYETYEKEKLYVIKKSGKKEEYDRNKLERSLKISFAKRLSDDSALKEIVDDVEKIIDNFNVTEITSDKIAEICIEIIKEIDKVSCFMYACNVYNIKSMDELAWLIDYINKVD